MTKWCDPLDLSKQKKLLDLGYIYPRGVRGGVALFFFGKSVFLKHPSVERAVKLVTQASISVCGAEARDGFVKATVLSRRIMPQLTSKKDFAVMINKS